MKTGQTETKQKSVSEIQAQLTATINQQGVDGEQLKDFRAERATLTVDANVRHDKRVSDIDTEINVVRTRLENSPSVVAELENQLAAENQRLAQVARENLLEQQNLVSRDIEKLSRQLVKHLKSALGVNNLLRDALSAEAAIKQKTGADVLENWCNPSMESLQKLTETCEAQLTSGVHTFQGGAGVVGNARPLQL